MSEEVKDAKRTSNDAFQRASKSIVIMSNRLQRFKDLKFLVGQLNEELAYEYLLRETLQIMSTIRSQIKRERTIGRQRGSLLWTVYIAMLIFELLVNGTPSSSIPSNIQTMSAALTGS